MKTIFITLIIIPHCSRTYDNRRQPSLTKLNSVTIQATQLIVQLLCNYIILNILLMLSVRIVLFMSYKLEYHLQPIKFHSHRFHVSLSRLPAVSTYNSKYFHVTNDKINMLIYFSFTKSKVS
jgi:uncharacterized membrane protein